MNKILKEKARKIFQKNVKEEEFLKFIEDKSILKEKRKGGELLLTILKVESKSYLAKIEILRDTIEVKYFQELRNIKNMERENEVIIFFDKELFEGISFSTCNINFYKTLEYLIDMELKESDIQEDIQEDNSNLSI